MVTKNNRSSFKDAISLLLHDHEVVKTKFEEFDKLGEKAFVSKKKLADEICFELINHTTLEEALFYPTVRHELKGVESLVDKAVVEHESAKTLITEIQAMSAEDHLFDAKVKVLAEQIGHHITEEEQELFPKVKKANIDLVGLCDKMVIRKKHLLSQ
jgi:hemerythrin-like domain-containing protein